MAPKGGVRKRPGVKPPASSSDVGSSSAGDGGAQPSGHRGDIKRRLAGVSAPHVAEDSSTTRLTREWDKGSLNARKVQQLAHDAKTQSAEDWRRLVARAGRASIRRTRNVTSWPRSGGPKARLSSFGTSCQQRCFHSCGSHRCFPSAPTSSDELSLETTALGVIYGMVCATQPLCAYTQIFVNVIGIAQFHCGCTVTQLERLCGEWANRRHTFRDDGHPQVADDICHAQQPLHQSLVELQRLTHRPTARR